MKPMRVYAYTGCDSCRKALKYLAAKGVTPEVVPIREQAPSLQELEAMLHRYQGDIRKLFNTSGQDYRAMKLGETLGSMPKAEALKLLASNGNLVKRPFVVTPKDGWVGFKPEEWDRRFH